MTPIAPLVTDFFLERLPIERGVSEHTCDTYALAFRLLLQFAASRLRIAPSKLSLEQIDAALVSAFLKSLGTNRGNSPATRNLRLAAIRSFMRFVEYRAPSALDQVRRVMAIPMKKTETAIVVHLSIDELQAILDAPDPRTRLGTRDRAMLHVAAAAGLRVSELVTLRLDGVVFDPRLSIRVFGKGRRHRVLPLWKVTATTLRAWLAIRGQAPVPEVFLNARGDSMSRSGFEYVLRRHVNTAVSSCPSLRDKRVSPHVLRHTCAMSVLRATGDIRKVALWLGHASIQTTEIYLSADPIERLETLEAVVPPSLRPGTFSPPDQLIAELQRR